MIKFPGVIVCLLLAVLLAVLPAAAFSAGRVDEDAHSRVYIPLVFSSKDLPPTAANPFRVHLPYFESRVRFPETAVFWLGRVDPTNNYADVRIGYNEEEIAVRLAVFDRRLWYDSSASAADLTTFDGASLFLNLNSSDGTSLDSGTYRFVSQLNWWEPRQKWQAAYQGAGSGWALAELPFTTERNWKGNAPNDDTDDRGWIMTIRIPFASLGLVGPPPKGTEWGLSVIIHDRDDQAGASIPDQAWPPPAKPGQPESWGRLVFGLPEPLVLPDTASGTQVVIRHGMDGAEVPDAHVGGHSICGDPYRPNFFNGWGDANYAGYQQVNIQNQYDVSDWPCFSKYYITFPFDSLPPGKQLLSASLMLYQVGNAGMGMEPPPEPSLIQVFTVKENWSESTLTWNNAPLAGEIAARAWVNPIRSIPGGPGVPNEWDLTAAAVRAYAAGEPLRLVLYSSDNAYNSGKYFLSSDAAGWSGSGRPTLTIIWGEP